MYQAYIRRFRPRTFEEVVGQEGITGTLKKAVETGRVANAYLFAGPRGIGKTSTARILAKALNCASDPTPKPCCECDSCLAIHRGEDIDVVEIDAASNTSVDHMRALRESAIYAPARSRFKVYIIDEAHMLSVAAFNALLKILEEPPPHVKFIFATTEPNRIPETVRSRMQRFDFRPIGTADIARRLRQIADVEKIDVSDTVLAAIARRAKGGLRDAESLLDQLTTLAFGREIQREDVLSLTGTIAEEQLADLLLAAMDRKPSEVASKLERLFAEGHSPADLLEQMHGLLRAVMLHLAAGGRRETDAEVPKEALEPLAAGLDLPRAVSLLGMLGHYRFEMRYAPDPQAVLEVALLRIASGEALADLKDLLAALYGGASGPPEPHREIAPAPGQSPAADNDESRPLPDAPSWWAEVLDAVEDRGLLGALRRVVPGERDAKGKVTLTVDSRFHFDRIEKRQDVVAGIVKKVLGGPVRIELALSQPKDAAKEGPDLFSHPAVRRIVSEFDGRLEGVE